MAKAKYQDNLEFLQWLKRYFDLNYNGEPYDAVGKRKGQDLFYILGGNKVGGTAGTGSKLAGGSAGGIPKNLGTKGASAMPKSTGIGGGKAAAGGAKKKAEGVSGDASD